MTAVFYAGINCSYLYRLVISRFEVQGNETAALSISCGKSLTEEEKSKIAFFSDYELSESKIALKLNKSKTVVHNFVSDPMNYERNKRRGQLSKRLAT